MWQDRYGAKPWKGPFCFYGDCTKSGNAQSAQYAHNAACQQNAYVSRDNGPQIQLALAAHGGEAHEAASAAEVTAEDKEIVINFLKDKMSRPGAKTKYYFKDFLELFPAKGTRDVKNVLSVLVSEESLEYWSSGSTTMYGLKGAGKQASSEGEN